MRELYPDDPNTQITVTGTDGTNRLMNPQLLDRAAQHVKAGLSQQKGETGHITKFAVAAPTCHGSPRHGPRGRQSGNRRRMNDEGRASAGRG